MPEVRGLIGEARRCALGLSRLVTFALCGMSQFVRMYEILSVLVINASLFGMFTWCVGSCT